MRKIKLFFVLSALLLAFNDIYSLQQHSFSVTTPVTDIDAANLFSNDSELPQKEQPNNMNLVSIAINNKHEKDFF